MIPDDPNEVERWLASWLADDPMLFGGIDEVLKDIVERPDRHQDELELIGAELDTPSELKERLENTGPEEWGYPAESWSDVERVKELLDAGLSRNQALVRLWKEKGYTHSEIAEIDGMFAKGTVDSHSSRISQKIEQAEQLLRTLGEYPDDG